MANNNKNDNQIMIEKKTISHFVIIFICAVIIFTAVRFGANAFANKRVFTGTTETETTGAAITTEEDSVVSLLKEMTPIALDEGSAFYQLYQSQSRINILCLGINEGMTDTIMVASYDIENQRVDIISLPRDTYYYRGSGFSSYASHKINAIYNSEGVVKLAEVVSEILYGMPIHYYGIVEYTDVKAIMEVIGGVEMEIPFHMKYDDPAANPPLHIDIPAGTQTIDSSNVMEFLRFRKGNAGYQSYSGGDVERQEVQQEFLKKVLKECLKLGNLTEVAKVALENVESDLTYGVAAKLALRAMKGLSADGINSYTLPGYADMIQELSFWVPSENELQNMLIEMYSDVDSSTEESSAAQ